MQSGAATGAAHRPLRDTTIRRMGLNRSAVPSADGRRLLKGRIVRFDDGSPIHGASVEVAGQTGLSDEDGSFYLPLEGFGADISFRASAPGYFACIESINVSSLGSGGLLSRVFRLVSDGSIPCDAQRIELDQDGSPSSDPLLALADQQPLGDLLDQLLAGPNARPQPRIRAHSDHGSPQDGFDAALERGLSDLFSGRPQEGEPWAFDDDDDELIFNEDFDDDALDEEERILFGDDSSDWNSGDVDYSVSWDDGGGWDD